MQIVFYEKISITINPSNINPLAFLISYLNIRSLTFYVVKFNIMAIDIKKTENGILIENKFLFNPTEIEIWIINLLPIIWEEMAYDRWNLLSIDFPWEYDIGWAFIKVFAWNWNKLNFLVSYEWSSFAVIQSPEVLELDEVCDMNTWIFPDESVSKKLDQLEMEWDRINISQLDQISFEEANQESDQNIEIEIQ